MLLRRNKVKTLVNNQSNTFKEVPVKTKSRTRDLVKLPLKKTKMNNKENKENLEPQYSLRKRKIERKPDVDKVLKGKQRSEVTKAVLTTKQCSPNTKNKDQNESTNVLKETNARLSSPNRIQILDVQIIKSPIQKQNETTLETLSEDELEIPDFINGDNMTNSTIVHSPKKQRPWRIDEHIFKRNPHFLHLKENNIPSYNQKPILRPTNAKFPTKLSDEKPSGEKANLVQPKLKDFIKERVTRAKTKAKETAVENKVYEFENENPDATAPQLFDEAEIEQSFTELNRREYVPKRRYKRIPSNRSEPEEETVVTKKHKTRQPPVDVEFEKWAESFNSHCSEIEKTHLEIA